jgi:hypothetical protein
MLFTVTLANWRTLLSKPTWASWIAERVKVTQTTSKAVASTAATIAVLAKESVCAAESR